MLARGFLLLGVFCVLTCASAQTCTRALASGVQGLMVLNPSSCATITAPYTKIDGTQTTSFGATVSTSSGSYVSCAGGQLDVAATPTGECGGTAATGAAAFCPPQFESSPGDSGLTATGIVTYKVFVETPRRQQSQHF